MAYSATATQRVTPGDSAFHMYLVLSGTFAFVARPERPSKSPRANVPWLLAVERFHLGGLMDGASAQEMWPYQLFSHRSCWAKRIALGQN